MKTLFGDIVSRVNNVKEQEERLRKRDEEIQQIINNVVENVAPELEEIGIDIYKSYKKYLFQFKSTTWKVESKIWHTTEARAKYLDCIEVYASGWLNYKSTISINVHDSNSKITASVKNALRIMVRRALQSDWTNKKGGER